MKDDNKKPLTYTKPEWARQELVNLNHAEFTRRGEFNREDPPRNPIDLEKLLKSLTELFKSEQKNK